RLATRDRDDGWRCGDQCLVGCSRTRHPRRSYRGDGQEDRHPGARWGVDGEEKAMKYNFIRGSASIYVNDERSRSVGVFGFNSCLVRTFDEEGRATHHLSKTDRPTMDDWDEFVKCLHEHTGHQLHRHHCPRWLRESSDRLPKQSESSKTDAT